MTRRLPAVVMRGGTSRGLYFHAPHLPRERERQDAIFAHALGSPDPYGRQIDGLGATSFTSKVIIVDRSPSNETDVSYTFAQVDVRTGVAGRSGNRGNSTAAAAPFAITEGLVAPTGMRATIPGMGGISVSIVDATNPVVFVRASDFGLTGTELPALIDAKPGLMDGLERVRATAAVTLGLASDREMARGLSAAHPKIALVASPQDYVTTGGDRVRADDCDLLVRMLSMGRAHQSVPLTGAMCTAAAAAIEGTIVQQVLGFQEAEGAFRIGHAAGVMEVTARADVADGRLEIQSLSVTRTARRLMEGHLLLVQS